KAEKNGITPYEIADAINNITRGQIAAQIIGEEDEIIEVNVQYEEQYRKRIDDLKAIKLRTQSGNMIALSKVATIEKTDSPVAIQRIDQEHAITFDVQYASSQSLGQLTKAVNEAIDDLALAEEVDMTYGGDRDLFESAINDMLLAFVLEIALVYIVMVALFELLKYPLFILLLVT